MKGGFQDDDVQFICEISGDTMICQFCQQNLQSNTPEQRQVHYEAHLDKDHGATTSHAPKRTRKIGVKTFASGVNTNPKFKPQAGHAAPEKSEKQNVFWYPSLTTPPPNNFTPGLILILRKALLNSHERGATVRAVLCYDKTVHISSENWDRGWGCGYRNFLMACTALMCQPFQPDYFPLLDHPTPPGIKSLQEWIESAWKQGYDEEGAYQLKRQLVGTHKWIGTAELYVALTSRSIPARLADFSLSSTSSPASLLPSRNTKPLTDWVVNYFSSPSLSSSPTSHTGAGNVLGSFMPYKLKEKEQETVQDKLRGASPVVMTDKMPLVLQHQGHSRLVVGYEVRNGSTPGMRGKGRGHEEVHLILFDPSKVPKVAVRQAALKAFQRQRREEQKQEQQQHYSQSTHNQSRIPDKPGSFASNTTLSKFFPLPNNASAASSSSNSKKQKLKQTVSHPISSIKNLKAGDAKAKKRKSPSDSDATLSSDSDQENENRQGGECERRGKRIRAGPENENELTNGGGGEDVIIIDSSDEEGEGEGENEKEHVKGTGMDLDPGKRKGAGREEEEQDGEVKLDWKKTLNHFTISEADLKKKDKYQILWFPLEQPLDETEMKRRRVVTGQKVC